MNEEPIIERSNDDTLGDGLLFAFVYAAFLENKPLGDAHEAASACMSRAQTLCTDVLREASAHSEPNINVIFARNPELRATFYDLFAESCLTFAEITISSMRVQTAEDKDIATRV